MKSVPVTSQYPSKATDRLSVVMGKETIARGLQLIIGS